MDDTVKRDVLYPDSLSGEIFEARSGPDSNGVFEAYHAEDDADHLPDGAKNGWFLPVIHVEHGEIWIAAPRDLREALVGLDLGDAFEVLSCEKSQDSETAPYYAEIALVSG